MTAPKRSVPKSKKGKSIKSETMRSGARGRSNKQISSSPTAKEFLIQLESMQSAAELKKYKRYFTFDENTPGHGDRFIGVRMGNVFNLAKKAIAMNLIEIEKLLENDIHEARAGACSIMDKQARLKTTTDERRKDLFDLYIRRHDRINNWDLVDLCAIHVIGRYLFKNDRKALYKLAKSRNPWERRTSIVSTAYFIREGQLDDSYKIAEILIHDENDLVQKATGWMLRFAGDKDGSRIRSFLNKYASTMPRITLRNTIEHFDKKEREYYLNLGKLVNS